jgi:lipid-binding SYLF domain-containing protein
MGPTRSEKEQTMKTLGTVMLCIFLAASTAAVAQDAPAMTDNRAAKRAAIDQMARETLERLLTENTGANLLADRAKGFAVFDSFKAAVLVSGGGGVGVAVDSSTGARTYMKMGTAGIGVGLGGQSYQIVFFFETQEAFDRFVTKGWQADASANAAAGTKGANETASFSNGVAVFQLTHKGLMAQADVSGTKYWKHKKLNR